MEIRKASPHELDRIMEIYAHARAFMVEHGNPRQWASSGYPSRELVEQDIKDGHCHVCLHEGHVVGVFYYNCGKRIDKSYENADRVNWQGDGCYGVVHRIASDGSVKGIGRFCLTWAMAQTNDLRIDTHGDNFVMQNLLGSLGFEQRGIVYVREDNDPRLAYQKIAK